MVQLNETNAPNNLVNGIKREFPVSAQSQTTKDAKDLGGASNTKLEKKKINGISKKEKMRLKMEKIQRQLEKEKQNLTDLKRNNEEKILLH